MNKEPLTITIRLADKTYPEGQGQDGISSTRRNLMLSIKGDTKKPRNIGHILILGKHTTEGIRYKLTVFTYHGGNMELPKKYKTRAEALKAMDTVRLEIDDS